MRVLLATIGSLGDLHPVLGLGIELRGRGHSVTIATSESHRHTVESASLPFAAIRPDRNVDPRRMREMFDQRRGPERLIRDFVMPIVRETHGDLLPLVQDADILVASELIIRLRSSGKKLGSPGFLSSQHQLLSFQSMIPRSYRRRRFSTGCAI